MDKTIAAAEANRSFSRLLRSVREGDSYVITSHGQPVARIAPISSNEHIVNAARAALREHLHAQKPVSAGRWTRAELYEDDP